MSHFTVLVVGEDVDSQLAPFQENNMGDCNPEYLEFTETESDMEADYKSGTATRLIVPASYILVRMPYGVPTFPALPNGSLADNEELRTAHDKAVRHHEFYVGNITGINKRLDELKSAAKNGTTEFMLTEHDALWRNPQSDFLDAIIPDVAVKRDVPFTELFATFEDYARDYCGFQKRDSTYGVYGYWDNPNSKWDWYQIGGRWSGFFKVKPIRLLADASSLSQFGFSDAEIQNLISMYRSDRSKFDSIVKKYKGKSSEITSAIETLIKKVYPKDAVNGERSWTNEKCDIPEDRVDQLRKRDLDLEGMYAEAEASANAQYDAFEKATAGITPPSCSWDDFVKGYPTPKEARDAWHKHPWIAAVNQANIGSGIFGPPADEYFCIHTGGREKFVKNARLNCLSTYAVLMDGTWYSHGEMGWFGTSNDSKSKDNWQEEFHNLLSSVPDDTLLTIVDCHV